MSWLRVFSKVRQCPTICTSARSSAKANLLEVVGGKSLTCVLKRRGAKTNPCGASFFRRLSLLCFPLPAVRVSCDSGQVP